MHVAGELNCAISSTLFLYGFHIASGLRMVAAADDQLGAWHRVAHNPERINHEFEPLIGSPLAERKDAVLRIAAPRKVRVFGSSRQNAVGADVNIVAAVFVVKDRAVSRHEYRDRIRQKEHSGGDCASHAIETRVPNACVL